MSYHLTKTKQTKQMDIPHLQQNIHALFKGLLNRDTIIQQQTILKAYFPDATYQNPYIVLHNRSQIIQSYAGLSNSCTDITVDLRSVEFNPDTLIVTVEIIQSMKPKALGGVWTITIRQHHDLQLEFQDSDNNNNNTTNTTISTSSKAQPLKIVRHTEHHHLPSLLLSTLPTHPLLTSLYNSTRSTLGTLSTTTTTLLNTSGLLDLVPLAYRLSSDTAQAMRHKVSQMSQKAIDVTHKAKDVAVPALEATGLPSLIRDTGDGVVGVVDWVKGEVRAVGNLAVSPTTLLHSSASDTGAALRCYSPTCRNGALCYSPTCSRSGSLKTVSVDALKKVVRGLYTGREETPVLRIIQ
ncbi:hypothetical protein BC832DRAFT_565347 [Gaertneriomyces semiglobifer]|nr:hypothetical protein BC832DRAFT_565347 [Gaertneriomyces semiglobifer]